MECGDKDPIERALREVSNSLTALMGTLRMIQECGDVGSTHLDRCLGLSRRMAKGVERLSSMTSRPPADAPHQGGELGIRVGAAAIARVACSGDRSSEDGGRSRGPRGVLRAEAAAVQPAR